MSVGLLFHCTITQKSGDHGDIINAHPDNDSVLDKIYAINARHQIAEKKLLEPQAPGMHVPEIKVPKARAVVWLCYKISSNTHMFPLGTSSSKPANSSSYQKRE